MGESSSGNGSRSRTQFSVLGERNGGSTPSAQERSSSGGAGGRGRGKRRRKPQPKRELVNPPLHDPDAQSSRRRRRRGRRGGGQSEGGRPRQPEQRPANNAPAVPAGPAGQIDPFDLFAAYHLGIAEDGTYRPTNIHDVARRFSTSAGGIRQTLAALGMDSDSVINSDFDMAMAQYDIQIAPEGVNIRELARNLYADYREASPNARDWEKELAADAAANAKTFGNDNE